MDNLIQFLKKLYPKDAQRLQKELIKYSNSVEKIEPVYSNAAWYKFMNLYVIYPDGLARRNKKPLEAICDHLDYVKQLGCNAVHILPFLDSPMVDKGFDIADFYKPKPEFGDLNDLKKISRRAQELGLRVFIDLVFNHISDQHEWYKKAIEGDEYYRKFFITRKDKPDFIKKYQKDNCVWAQYKDENTIKDAMIIFPENAGPIPHWRLAKDGYWYYHTFYEEQLDLDWDNPEVFLECAKVLIFWAKMGFNFRLDAIPYMGLSGFKERGQDHTKTLMIVAALNYISKDINPEVTFIVEVFSEMKTMIEYFGDSNVRNTELSYNYHLCTHLWLSIINQNDKFIWENIDRLLNVPVHAEWINFLRNHDELSLNQITESEKQLLNDELLPRGATFREGNGVSGRTFSFLKHNTKRHIMAYFLLCSLPGSIQIPYGDEVGIKNVPYKKLRKDLQKDTRNINRGVLTKNDIESVHGKKIFAVFCEMLQKRAFLREYMNIAPERLNIEPSHIFSAMYKSGSSKLIVIINLCDKQETYKLDLRDYQAIMKINNVRVTNEKITLGPYAGIWLQK